jgi:hypothetical protein
MWLDYIFSLAAVVFDYKVKLVDPSPVDTSNAVS